MRVWIDAQLSPGLAAWLRDELGVDAIAVRDLGMRDAEVPAIFAGARSEGAVVLTKDSDFADLVARLGPPPQIVWLTCGNTSNTFLRGMLRLRGRTFRRYSRPVNRSSRSAGALPNGRCCSQRNRPCRSPPAVITL